MRVVRTPAGTIAIDPTGRVPGRGAYLCRDAACFDLAGRRRAVAHALRTPIPQDIEALIAAGPDGLDAVAASQTARVTSSPPDTSNNTVPEGGAHGQE